MQLLSWSVVALALSAAAAEDFIPEPEPEHVYGWNCNTATGLCHNNATAPAEYHTQEDCRAVCVAPPPPAPGPAVGWECNSDTGNCQSNVRPRPPTSPTLAAAADPAVGSSGYCEPAGPCTFLHGGAVPGGVHSPGPSAGAGACYQLGV